MRVGTPHPLLPRRASSRLEQQSTRSARATRRICGRVRAPRRPGASSRSAARRPSRSAAGSRVQVRAAAGRRAAAAPRRVRPRRRLRRRPPGPAAPRRVALVPAQGPLARRPADAARNAFRGGDLGAEYVCSQADDFDQSPEDHNPFAGKNADVLSAAVSGRPTTRMSPHPLPSPTEDRTIEERDLTPRRSTVPEADATLASKGTTIAHDQRAHGSRQF